MQMFIFLCAVMTTGCLGFSGKLGTVHALGKDVAGPCADGVRTLFEIRAMRQCDCFPTDKPAGPAKNAYLQAAAAAYVNGAITSGAYVAAVVQKVEKLTGLYSPVGKATNPKYLTVCGIQFPI